MEERRSFVLYADYEQAFSALPPAEQGALIMAVFSYARTGEVAPLSGGAAMAFLFICGQLDRDWGKYDEIREKRAEAGRKGGKQTQANKASAYAPKQRRANQAVNGTGDDTGSDIDSDTDTGGEDGEERSGYPPGVADWSPPTVAQVARFCSEQGLVIDAARFVKHYTGRDWLLGGGEPMTDWKAAAAGWAKREGKGSTGAAGPRRQDIPSEADYEAGNNFL